MKSTCAVALRNTFRVKARPEPGVRLQLPPAAAAAAPAEAADPNPQTFSKIVKIMTSWNRSNFEKNGSPHNQAIVQKYIFFKSNFSILSAEGTPAAAAAAAADVAAAAAAETAEPQPHTGLWYKVQYS